MPDAVIITPSIKRNILPVFTYLNSYSDGLQRASGDGGEKQIVCQTADRPAEDLHRRARYGDSVDARGEKPETELYYAYHHDRHVQDDYYHTDAERLYKMADGSVEALEFYIQEGSPVANVRLSKLQLKPPVLVAGIVRDGNLILPTGMDEIKAGDSVIIVTSIQGFRDVKDILK